MNNYKFRGKTAGKWVYGFLLKNIDGKCAILDEDNTVNFNYLSYSIVNPVNFNYLSYSIVNPKTVGQWTGLKDKNGKEIYEGDIVNDCWGTLFNGLIKFEKGRFFISWRGKYTPDYTFDEEYNKDIFVVGNKWDNPELLGEGVK